VIDHLHTGGTANWFYCSQAGGTASASGYTSTSWARTIGDDHGTQGYVPAVYFGGAENYWLGLPACGGSSTSGGTQCTAGTNRAGTEVAFCPVWLPSGGVPIYSTTSTTSTIVDHLHTGGNVNWFYCQQNGGTATAGGYTSSNWAKTIGDDHGSTGYVPAVYFSGAQNYWYGLGACGTPPPSPSDGACTASTNGSGQGVYYCPVWLPSGGVPIYAGTSTSSAVVDHLLTGGSANWFYCSVNGSTATVGGYSSSNWAKTIGDQHGATGYVPAVYFTGAQNYWPGLTTCSGSGNAPPPPPPSNGGTPSSGSLTCHGYSVPYTSLPALTITLLTKACAETGTYTWGGGHGGAPGKTYGHYDGSDPASLNDANVLGFDCSGFVRYIYYETTGNDALDGVTWQQWTLAQAMPHKAVISTSGWSYSGGWNGPSASGYLSQLKPGDLMFYGHNADEHVAIYIGGGRQVNAYESGQPFGVTTSGGDFWGAIRLW
jgi:cell wall-associated NlpC family hydrolase